jgi:hypothetical protein
MKGLFDNTGILVRPLYKRCGRCGNPHAICSCLVSPTVHYYRRYRILHYRRDPNRIRTTPDLGGSGFARTTGSPCSGLCYPGTGSSHSSHRSSGDRTWSGCHRMVAKTGTRRLPPYSRFRFRPRRLHRLHLCPSTNGLTIAGAIVMNTHSHFRWKAVLQDHIILATCQDQVEYV